MLSISFPRDFYDGLNLAYHMRHLMQFEIEIGSIFQIVRKK